MKATDLTIGQTVYFSHSVPAWNKPYVMKRHHAQDYNHVILRGEVLGIRGKEFQVLLKDNNAFENDGESFVFHEDSLLCDQDFKNFDRLGKWEYHDNNKQN